MIESKKPYNKWMVIPFDNKFYEKLNEEKKEKINDSFNKKYKNHNKPEAITKYLNELPPSFLESNTIRIKPDMHTSYLENETPEIKQELSDDTVLNASFNDNSNYMDLDENIIDEKPKPIDTETIENAENNKLNFKTIKNTEKTTGKNEDIGKKEKRLKLEPKIKITNKKQSNLKRLKNNHLNQSHIKDFLDILEVKDIPSTNTRSKTIKRAQSGSNIINWTIYKNIY